MPYETRFRSTNPCRLASYARSRLLFFRLGCVGPDPGRKPAAGEFR